MYKIVETKAYNGLELKSKMGKNIFKPSSAAKATMNRVKKTRKEWNERKKNSKTIWNI